MSNTIGKIFTLTTFGESHGACIGGVIDGCPPGLHIDTENIQYELERRKPKGNYSTPRTENDNVQFLSGLLNGYTTGAPIAFIIPNINKNTEDYEHLKDIYRPSHADYTYQKKYGIRDHRGGGRASARETVAWVVAGAIAKQILKKQEIEIQGYVSQIGKIKSNILHSLVVYKETEQNPYRFPDKEQFTQLEQLLNSCQQKGDTVGGIITCTIKNCPIGLGEPVFDKLQADLAKAMLSINAVKGFEYGEGFASASMFGSQHNDLFNSDFSTRTNHSGGIQGGISNGEEIIFKVAFKPIPSIAQPIEVIDKNGIHHKISIGGRHDICPVPRAVPIVETMAALVIVDHLLRK